MLMCCERDRKYFEREMSVVNQLPSFIISSPNLLVSADREEEKLFTPISPAWAEQFSNELSSPFLASAPFVWTTEISKLQMSCPKHGVL